MSLPHALLTALIERACSGSELAERFDRSIGHFWHATHQQIYRELGRLEEAGWVKSHPTGQGRGRKRTYQVLPAGRAELKRWVRKEDDPTPLRAELMVRLRAEAAIGSTGLERELKRRLVLHERKRALYRDIEARDFSGKKASREMRLQHLVLRAGIAHETFWIDICKDAMKILAEPIR
jgi:DNA-binding PadR family transcriptional regulator